MKIMVVDDSSTVRTILRKELEGGGHSVREAENGRVGVELFERGRPDLITLDVEMPELDGFGAAARIRELEAAQGVTTPTPIIFITSLDTLEDRERGFQLGAADFVVKPSKPGEILSRVERILARETPLKGLTALVVEDSQAARHVLAQCLREEGMTVLEAEDGESAWELVQERTEGLGLIIVDYALPGMNGVELTEKARTVAGLEHVPVIAMSALKDAEYKLEMFRAGVTDFLVKPFAREEFIARIKTHRDNFAMTRELERQVEELERLNRLKDGFLAVAAHDLRAPLTSILGFAAFLESDPSLTKEQRQALGYIHSSGEHLSELLGDLLDLTSIGGESRPIALRELDIVEVVSSAVENHRHLALPKKVALKLSVEQPDGTPKVLGDESSLRRVLANLLTNAIKFTPESGEVRVVIEDADGANLGVRVTDTGIGIPKDLLPRLFERFTPSSREGTAGEKSTGLGLAICKELMERQLGRIEVESEEGRGATFRMLIPTKRED